MNFFDIPGQVQYVDATPAMQLVVLILFALVTILWLWSLVDTLRRQDFKDNVEKLVWVFVIISTFFLGTVLYYIIAKKRK